MLHLYEIKVMNGDKGEHEGHVHEIPVVAPSFVEAVSHVEGFLKEHHPNDRIVGGGETVSNLFITKGAMEEMAELLKKHRPTIEFVGQRVVVPPLSEEEKASREAIREQLEGALQWTPKGSIVEKMMAHLPPASNPAQDPTVYAIPEKCEEPVERSSDFAPNGDPVEAEERIPQCIDPTAYEEPACPDVPGDGYQYLEDA